MLAAHLDYPFIELDRLIEQDYGASLPMLIEMSGLSTFRRYERACLERVIAEHAAAVVATAGGIVSSPETYALLLQRTHTVWIKAAARPAHEPGDGAGRLPPDGAEPRGDGGPGRHSRARGADYARAEAELDTSSDTVDESFGKLKQIVERYAGGAR